MIACDNGLSEIIGAPASRHVAAASQGICAAGDPILSSGGWVRIAYAVHGNGPPLLISTCWLSHLQFDWESPVWRHFVSELGRIATVIRFDERGHGLSDWDVTDLLSPNRGSATSRPSPMTLGSTGSR